MHLDGEIVKHTALYFIVPDNWRFPVRKDSILGQLWSLFSALVEGCYVIVLDTVQTTRCYVEHTMLSFASSNAIEEVHPPCQVLFLLRLTFPCHTMRTLHCP